MKFIAFPVKEGDSFFLKNENNILVDTGEDEDECLNLLKSELNNNEELDLVVITHYDSDHVSGLLNLLKSDIKIKELWLPDYFGRICETLLEDKNNIIKSTYSAQSNCEIEHQTIHSEINKKPYRLLKIRKVGLFTKYHISIPNGLIKILYLKKSHIIAIKNIVDTCKAEKIPIRWIKYTQEYKSEIINPLFNICGLNCYENKNNVAYQNDTEVLIELSEINKKSLVFKYCNPDYPNILFTADSGFKFVGKKSILLNNKSIITAPHHGSNDREHKKIYKKISGNDLIFVRSDLNHSKRPCQEYKDLDKKYCTICNNSKNNKPVKIELDFINGNWKTNNSCCKCI